VADPGAAGVVLLRDLEPGSLARLLGRYGLAVVVVPEGQALPGSYWGEPEAGLVGDRLYAQRHTPAHSALHEACHYVCMDAARRARLDTDAGGDDEEENAVCYLSILLADELPGFGAARMMRDMDAWGYSFRLGSARAWFERDAPEVLQWLRAAGLVDARARPTWCLRSG
jgi:hypothetical protein